MQVVLHSPDSIAPVGVLHPTAFHIECKQQGAAQDTNQQPFQQQQQHGVHDAVVIEVPESWQPHSAATPGSCTEDDAAAVWETLLETTLSPSHAHIICSVAVAKSTQPAACSAGRALTAADTAAALEASLAAITAELAGLRLGWLDSCFVHLYVADMSHFGTANEVYCRHLPQVNPPSRACVQVRAGTAAPARPAHTYPATLLSTCTDCLASVRIAYTCIMCSPLMQGRCSMFV